MPLHNQYIKDLFRDPDVQSTLQASSEYLQLIESSAREKYATEKLIDLLHLSLTKLYSCAIRLPNITLVIEEDGEDISLPANEEMRKTLEVMLGEYTDYSQAFDPLTLFENDNYSQGWLTDDLIDIYNDLKKVMLKIERESDIDMQDALWGLKWGLGAHWGHHLINALRYLHYIRYDRLARHT